MRIIAGKWRARKLSWPARGSTRPMPDRVRESVFSMLGSLYDMPGSLPVERVADVFAGSGSMGLEALSRGASSCVFFERGREAVAVLQRNLDMVGAGGQATVVTRDAWTASIPRPSEPGFDLVLLDPPYRDSRDTSTDGLVWRYLSRLAERGPELPLIVLHHPAASRFLQTPWDMWEVFKTRTFGTNGITMFAPTDAR